MGLIEWSKGFLNIWKGVFKKELGAQGKRLEVIEDSAELPSPLPRLI